MQAAPHHGHGQELGAKGPEHLHGAGVGGLLDGHEIPGIEQGAGDEVEALLRPVDDENLLGARLEAEAQQVGSQVFAQRRVAARRIILQELAPFLADHPVEHATEGVRGEEIAIGHPTGKGDEARSRARDAAVVLPPPGIGGAHLRALGEKARPVEARCGGAGRLRRRGNLIGHKGALPHVRPSPARGDQLVIRQGHRRAVHRELPRQLAGGGQLDSGAEQAQADQPLDVELDLAGQRQPPRPVTPPVERNPHMGHCRDVPPTVNLQLDDLHISH